MIEQIVIRVLALLIGLMTLSEISAALESRDDIMSKLHFVKCVPEQRHPRLTSRSVYLVDGFRFESNTPLIMDVAMTTRTAKQFRVVEFRKIAGISIPHFVLEAKASDGEKLTLDINESGLTRARLNEQKMQLELRCRLGRS